MAETVLPAKITLKALTECDVLFVEPASAPVATVAPGEQVGRRTGVAGGWRAALLACLAVLLLLALPVTRTALAAIPLGLGDWCAQQRAEGCARQAWAISRHLAPRDSRPLLAVGALAFRQGDLAGAEGAFRQAREADPRSPEAHNNLGVVCYGRGEYPEAVAAFEQALLLEPGSASIEENLGDSLLAMRAYDKAIQHYRVALSLGESEAETLANLAVALHQVGETAAAARSIEQALAKASDDEMRDRISLTLSALQAAEGDGNDR